MTPKPEDPQIATLKAKYKADRAVIETERDAAYADLYARFQTRLLLLRNEYNKALHAIETAPTNTAESL